MALLSSIGVAIGYMMMSDTLIQSLLKEKQMAIKHQIVISGGSKIAYWLSHFIMDVITHAIPASLTLYTIDLFEVNAPNVSYLFIAFCFANPLFIYALNFLFSNDSIASIFVRVFYFAFGGVAPIAMQVLMIISKQTMNIGKYLKWYFTLVPIFNLNHGYISINSRSTIEMLYKMEQDTLEPLDWECAGESLVWICIIAGLALFFIYTVENNIYIRLFRPYYKPILTLIEMIHESIQIKKPKKVYDIRETAGMEEWDHN